MEIAAVYVTLFRDGRVIKRFEYHGYPLYLDIEENYNFTQIRLEPMTCRAMILSGLPIDPNKVKYFSKFNQIDCWACKNEYDWDINSRQTINMTLGLNEYAINLRHYNIDKIKLVRIQLRNSGYDDTYGGEDHVVYFSDKEEDVCGIRD